MHCKSHGTYKSMDMNHELYELLFDTSVLIGNAAVLTVSVRFSSLFNLGNIHYKSPFMTSVRLTSLEFLEVKTG